MSEITLLDGSIGQELVHRKGDRATPLWSTQVMLARPDLVRELHADYFAAGATVATLNTYAVLKSRLDPAGQGDRVPDLVRSATNAAVTARDAHGSGRLAASMGPVLASYRPDLKYTVAEAIDAYADNIRIMDPEVDLYLVETLCSLQEIDHSLTAVRQGTDKPIWLALSSDDFDGTRLRSGEPISAAVDYVQNLPDAEKPDALLINCTRPEVVADGLTELARLDLPFGAYANAFTAISDGFKADRPTVDALEHRSDLGPADYADRAMAWVDMGATIVGGCCEVGPDHIAELARRLRSEGHTLI